MLAPLVVSVSASLKTTREAAAIPPTYFTHQLSLDSYAAAVELPGGPADLSPQQRRRRFSHHRVLPAPHHSGRLRARPLPGAGQGDISSSSCSSRLIIPYQALLTPIFFMFATAEADQHAGRARHRPHHDPASLQRLHHAEQLRGGAAASWKRPPSSTAATACRCSYASHLRRSGRRSSRWRSSLSSPRGTSSWRAGDHEPRRDIHPAADPRRLPARRPASAAPTGACCRRASPSRSSPACSSTCSCRNTMFPASSAAPSNERATGDNDRAEAGAGAKPRPRAADHPRRGAARRGQRRDGRRRRSTTAAACARRRATKVDCGRQGDRLPAERPRPEPASRPELHGRADHHRQLRPLHHADHGGARGVPRRPAHRGVHVQRHRRPRARGASTSNR